MRQWRVWLVIGALGLLLAACGYYSFSHWPASTVGASIGAVIILVFTLSRAPGEKALWMLPVLGAVAVLTFVALGIFLFTVCWHI